MRLLVGYISGVMKRWLFSQTGKKNFSEKFQQDHTILPFLLSGRVIFFSQYYSLCFRCFAFRDRRFFKTGHLRHSATTFEVFKFLVRLHVLRPHDLCLFSSNTRRKLGGAKNSGIVTVRLL